MRPAVHARDAGKPNHQALEGPTRQAFLTSLGQHCSAAHGGRMLSANSSSVAMDVLARTLASRAPRVGLIAPTFHSGLHTEALCHAHQALAISGVTAHRDGQAEALNAIGRTHASLGHYQATRAYCAEALTPLRELDDQHLEGSSWDSPGYAHHNLGEYDAVTPGKSC